MSAGQLFVILAASVVGFALFRYGKKQKRGPQLAAGILLMVFPYFVSNLLWMLGIAGALAAGLWLALRAGL
jgi:hypothetical protein